MQPKTLLIAMISCLVIFSCGEDKEKENPKQNVVESFIKPIEIKEFGFNLNDYIVVRDTIRKGDSFGEILERNSLAYPKIFHIAEKARDSFDIRKLQVGKPYTMLFSKDSLQTPESFIYQPSKENYVVINFKDSIYAYNSKKPVTIVEKSFSGIIRPNSIITNIMQDHGISQVLAYKMSDDIYAWTIDFEKLQPGDKFKVIYEDKYIDDSIYVGVHNIKAAYFEHKGEELYAFEFETDSIKHIVDYFDENAKNLRRAFLKSPIALRYRISSKYNLNRRIAYYGYKRRPHKGTDFAASIGTPILATANGTVTESTRRGGNGKYVKIKHNNTYSTQYLHMKSQAVKRGQYVKQGDVIGYIGMTGNTGGPHVCYRFWKNGVQVDPFKQKLPEAEPISDSLKLKFMAYVQPIRAQLDDIKFRDMDLYIENNEPVITPEIE